MFASSKNSIMKGAILLWSGSIASIPTGWVLCNGSNDTPDLRDKFIVGAKQDDAGTAKTNVSGSLTQSGGNINHTHEVYVIWEEIFEDGEEEETVPTGTSSTETHLPPYYALAYIMKV